MAQAMLAALPSLPRATLACITEGLIDRMDEMDPDLGLEVDESDVEHDGAEIEMGVLISLYDRDQTRPPREGGWA